MEWPELLRQYTEALRQFTMWMDAGCLGAPPALVDASQVRGPVPAELRSYATEVVAQVAQMEGAVARRLSTLRDVAGHASPARTRYDVRPMPRYLDALG